MNDLNAILKNLDWKHRRPFGWGSSPDADWKVIFTATIYAILLVSAFNSLLFTRVEKGKLVVLKEETVFEPASLDMEKLKETLSHYQNKAALFQRLKSGAEPVVVDPSI